MPWSLAETLRRSFHLAALRNEMSAIRSPRQRAQARAIMNRCEDVRQLETRTFNEQYLTRVEIAQRRLISQAGSKARDMIPAWAGRDRFNPSDTLRQAQREVRNAHEQRIAKIDGIETRWLESLMQRSMRENNPRGKAREDFGRAANRRSGKDRRNGGLKRNGPSR